MTNSKHGAALIYIFLAMPFLACKPFGDTNATKDLGGTAAASSFKQLKVLLGYAGTTVVQNNNQYVLGQGNQAVAPGTMLAVYDHTGKAITGFTVKRLQFLQTHGTTTSKNGVAALNMGRQGLPSYSIDLDIAGMHCSSLDRDATLVLGVLGDLVCFSQDTEQGKFAKSCLQPGGMGHVELSGNNPVCISKVIPSYGAAASGSGTGQRVLTGDPVILDYNYLQHREIVEYLPTFRRLQDICENPGLAAGQLVSQGFAPENDPFTGTPAPEVSPANPNNNTNRPRENSQATAGPRPLTICQCRPQTTGTTAGGLINYDLLAESRRIHRNLLLWKGQQPSKDHFRAFQQACQDGTALQYELPPNLSAAEANATRNETICSKLQGLGQAAVRPDRCLCSRDKVPAGLSTNDSAFNRPITTGNVAVAFDLPEEQFIGQCLNLSTTMTTRDFCEANNFAPYEELGTLAPTAAAADSTTRAGCRGCPTQPNSGQLLERREGEVLPAYARRCLGVSP